MPLVRTLALASCVFAVEACADAPPRANILRYEIVATHPHDVRAFTQGLVFVEGALAESTGARGGLSTVTIREIASGNVRKRRTLDARHFGEGLALAGDRLLLLTWRSGLALAFDRALAPAGEFRYAGEGWGLTFDGEHWLMSDGSDRITVRRIGDFSIVRELRVTDRGRPVLELNELEFAHGRLFANVWHSDRIAVIDPGSGTVRGWLDLAALRKGFVPPPGWDEREHVLNGIAFNPANGHFYVTGKCWPVLYELRLPELP